MGKQINYYMGYEDFLLVAQKAIDLGCVIYRGTPDENGKLVYGRTLDIISKDELSYYFHLPEAGEIEIEICDGKESISVSYNKSSLSLIEAGYSGIDEKDREISRNRLFCITGYDDEEGVFVYRPESLTKVYNALVRRVKKVAPYRELHDGYYSIEDEKHEHLMDYYHKEYISDWCLQKKYEGFSIF